MSCVPVLISIREGKIVVDISEPQIQVSGPDARRIADALHDAADLIDQPPIEPGAGHDEPLSDRSDEDIDHTVPRSAKDPDNRQASSPTPANIAPKTTSPSSTVVPPLFRRRVPKSIKFSGGARKFVADKGISTHDIEEVIANPDEQWEGINPGAMERPTVVVREDIAYGAVYYAEDGGIPYVISVQPRYRLQDQRREISGAQPKISGGPKRAAIDSLDALITAARRDGLDFEQGKNHGKIFDRDRPELGCYTVSITPSDYRAYANAAADIRKMFDVTL